MIEINIKIVLPDFCRHVSDIEIHGNDYKIKGDSEHCNAHYEISGDINASDSVLTFREQSKCHY